MNNNNNNKNYSRRMFGSGMTLLCALFVAMTSILYILYRDWSAQLENEKWKDYDECGIG